MSWKDTILDENKFKSWMVQNAKPTNRLTKKFIAGEIINGGRVVYVNTDEKIYPFDITNPFHYDKYVGVAETSTNSGDVCTVVTYGITMLIGSGWKAGWSYYINSEGFLTDTPPEIGLVKQIGVGVNNDKILIIPVIGFEII